jgi:hypothetical protein
VKKVKKSSTMLVFFGVITLVSLYSREVTINVLDNDLGIPLEGAIIQAPDGKDYECDYNGNAIVHLSDEYPTVVQITYPGYDSIRKEIPPDKGEFVFGMSLSGIMESQELVIEASRPGVSETRSGRSVAISGKELSQSAQIGIVEDVMTAIKLLPGVGYSSMFNAMPSIRGGEPGDLVAVMDGFYIDDPYHLGGGISIFDPRMVQSAQLSHGVFSSRYGHTISGLLEITSKKPSFTEAGLEVGLSSSAANVNVAIPFAGKGGIIIMGKLTYWDPFVWLAKQFIDVVNYIDVAPFIRSGAFSGAYRFTPTFELTASGYLGGDGAGAHYENESTEGGLTTKNDMKVSWNNLIGFLTAGVTYNPQPVMVLRGTVGAGFHSQDLDGFIINDVNVPYTSDFIAAYGPFPNGATEFSLRNEGNINSTSGTGNVQLRADFDWDIGHNILVAAGVQELYTIWTEKSDMALWTDFLDPSLGPGWYRHIPFHIIEDIRNNGFFTSGYVLAEYTTQRLGAELGLRIDQFSFVGKNFSLATVPAFNPRLNVDFNVFKSKGFFDSLDLTFGTGLFTSMNDGLANYDGTNKIDELKQNGSWTTIVGAKVDFLEDYTFNLEMYYKYGFNRMYSYLSLNTTAYTESTVYKFDGESQIFGFDFMLQKFASRHWDGWISYSFNYARYRNPGYAITNALVKGNWYYPNFHHFHTLNMVLNYKPLPQFNIAARFSFVSGKPKSVVDGDPTFYPVMTTDGTIIQRYRRTTKYSDTERDGFTIPLDLKFSWYRFSKTGKVQQEIYVAIENVFAGLQTRQRNTTFNQYTGKEDNGSQTASYDLPIPMVSFGFTWSY